MRYATALVIGFGFLMCGCTSREVTRVTSPNGRLEAVVFESLGGAIDDVDDEVWVVPKGSHSGAHVASFDDAIKGEHSWGVNVKWDSANHLVIEYLRAGQANLLIRKTVIAGQDIQVTLRGGPQDGPCAQPCPD